MAPFGTGSALQRAVQAATAAVQGLAGAAGATTGEFIAQQLYPGIDRNDLTEEQRQTISALSTLAAGLAGGVAGDSMASAVAGAQAGKNAVENNWLSDHGIVTFTEKYAKAKTEEEKAQLVVELKKLDVQKQGQALATAIRSTNKKQNWQN